jgi:Icc protein
MVLLAQISDLHLDGTARATERATRVLDYLRGLPQPVDAVLVTGDIADHGAPSEYEEAARLLALPVPVLPCPGNHDVRQAYRKALLGQSPDAGPINRVHHVGGMAILMCDSSIPERNEGHLDAETLAWIDATLDGTPALIAFHHPATVLHEPFLDSIRLQNTAELAALLDGHPEVVALLVGHAHTAAAGTFAGRPMLVAPAVTWTMRLPWEGSTGEGKGIADLDQPPALAYHVIDDEHHITTHYRVLPMN